MIIWLADALRAEGLDVREVPGWKTRGRPYPFSGAEGVMFHHTASGRDSGPRPSLPIVTDGREGLPGPLCHVLIERGSSPAVWVVAAGYANHAGLGGPWRSVPQDSGNRHIVGVECENDGRGESWSAMLSTCDRVFAAILKYQGHDAGWCVGHKEWAPARKINPYGVDMNDYRARLASYMEGNMAGEFTDNDRANVVAIKRFVNGFQNFFAPGTDPMLFRTAGDRAAEKLAAAAQPLSDAQIDELATAIAAKIGSGMDAAAIADAVRAELAASPLVLSGSAK